MLKFSISFLLLFLSIGVIAQDKKTDSVAIKTQRYGLRVGADLSKIARTFYEKQYKGFEIVADYRLTQKHYLAAEIGTENKTIYDNSVNFTTRGTYIKVGFDYNGYENWLNMENIIHLGLRYGTSTFSQQLNTYKVYNTDNYFPGVPDTVSGTKYNDLSAQWVEIVAGVKAELFHNLFIGFSLRANYLVSNKTPENFDNLYIPGFNKTYNGKFGAGFNYTLSYFIPIYKVTSKSKLPASESKPKK